MNTNIRKMGTVLLAIGLCAWSTQTFAQTTQTTTTLTTTKGAFTEYVPGSETVVVRSETNPTPLRYVVTKQTTVVDETGAPVMLERIPAGSPLSVQYTGTGNRLVASRIIVNKAPVATQETTTTTTRPLSREERHQLKEAEEKRRHELKEQREHPERALENPTDEEH